MKLIIDKKECWIKDDAIPSNFNQMNDNEKWDCIFDSDLLHREDGPAIIYSDKNEYWFLNGLLHREDGPAIIQYNGHQEWHLNELWHRIDGPAIIWSDGSQAWYLNGIEVDEKIYKKIERSTKEKLLMYAVLPKYKDYISLIEYQLMIYKI